MPARALTLAARRLVVSCIAATIPACNQPSAAPPAPAFEAAPTAAAAPSPTPHASVAGPAPAAPAGPGASLCTSDAGCAIDATTLDGRFKCCPGCEERAVSTTDLARLRAECAARPPSLCPPLGCAHAPMHALCEAGSCVLRPPKTSSGPPATAPLPQPRECDPGGPIPTVCVPSSQTRGASTRSHGCKADPGTSLCTACRAVFTRTEGGQCCYLGLSRLPQCHER